MFLHRCKSYQFKKTTLEPNPTAVNWHQFDSCRFLCGKCSNGFENTLNSNYLKWNKGHRWPFSNYSITSIPWHLTIWDFRAVFWCYHTMPSELRAEFSVIRDKFHQDSITFSLMNLELLILFYQNLKLMSNSHLGMRSLYHSQRDAIFILSDNDARKVNRLQES